MLKLWALSARSVCTTNVGGNIVVRRDGHNISLSPVLHRRNRVPSVILYTEQQLRDLRSFCFDRSHGSVLGFDKTYNLVFVLDAVFGSDGVNKSDNVVNFDSACDKMVQSDLYQDLPQDIKHYTENRVIALLKQNLAAKRAGWTNNNCESINDVLKCVTDWKKQSLPDLIDKLRVLIDGQ